MVRWTDNINGEPDTPRGVSPVRGRVLGNPAVVIQKGAGCLAYIVANMVNYDGKSIRDSFIGLKGKKIAQRLTQEYKLIPAVKKNLNLTHLENLSDTEANRYKVYMAISEALRQCRNMQELETQLMKQGIETQYKYKGHSNEKQGISFKIGDFCFKGSKVDRKFSFSGLQKALSQQQSVVHEQKIDVNEITESNVKLENKQLLFNKIVKLKRKGSKSESKDEDMFGEKLEGELLKGAGKVLENLLKHENTGEGLPYESTEEALKRKRRKPRHKL